MSESPKLGVGRTGVIALTLLLILVWPWTDPFPLELDTQTHARMHNWSVSYFGRWASAFTWSPDCPRGAPAEEELAQGQRRRCRFLSASCQNQPFVMPWDACGVEACKGARLSGLNFSQLLQGDQEVASEGAIFSSSKYSKMSSVQGTGKHFTLSLVLKAVWVLGAFFPSS